MNPFSPSPGHSRVNSTAAIPALEVEEYRVAAAGQLVVNPTILLAAPLSSVPTFDGPARS